MVVNCNIELFGGITLKTIGKSYMIKNMPRIFGMVQENSTGEISTMNKSNHDPAERRYRRVLEELKVLREEIQSLRSNPAVEFQMDETKHHTIIEGLGDHTHYPQRCQIVGEFIVFLNCNDDRVSMITTATNLQICRNGGWGK